MKKRLILTDPALVIKDPATRLRVPLEGIDADPRMDFWRRRIREGSMIEGPAPAAKVRPYKRGPSTHGEHLEHLREAAAVAPDAKPRHFLNEPPKA